MSVAFGLSKLSFLVPKKGQLSFSERREDLKFSGLDKKQGHPTTVFYRMLLDAVLGYLEYF